MTAKDKIKLAYNSQKHICIGLDTDLQKIPPHLKNEKNPVVNFNKQIIDSTREDCGAYKINFAFYEAEGLRGIENLIETIEHIGTDKFIIGDAKRGDIGNTAEQYAKSASDIFKCDSVTVNPYMGLDTLEPFIARDDNITYVLGLTSNPGANDFEKIILNDGRFLFQKIISDVKSKNKNENCGIVFGATKLNELIENLQLLKGLHLLIPGVGAQGGDLKQIVSELTKQKHHKFLVNVSRSVLYKSSGKDFAAEAKKELLSLNEVVRKNYE